MGVQDPVECRGIKATQDDICMGPQEVTDLIRANDTAGRAHAGGR